MLFSLKPACTKVIVNIAWLRLLTSFMFVLAVVLCVFPLTMHSCKISKFHRHVSISYLHVSRVKIKAVELSCIPEYPSNRRLGGWINPVRKDLSLDVLWPWASATSSGRVAAGRAPARCVSPGKRPPSYRRRRSPCPQPYVKIAFCRCAVSDPATPATHKKKN